MIIVNPYSLHEGLTFTLESVITFHKENQTRTATVMAHYNEDLVKAYFEKLKEKLDAALSEDPSKCVGEPVKIEPKEPEK